MCSASVTLKCRSVTRSVDDVGDLFSLMVGAKRSVEVCFVSFTIQYKSFHTGRGMSTSNDEISNCCARRLQPPCIWSMDDVGDLFSLSWLEQRDLWRFV